MLVLASSTELEAKLEEEAAKRGLEAPEYALRLIESLLLPVPAGMGKIEAERLMAIDELMGCGAGTGFSSATIRKERDVELKLEEEKFLRRFGSGL